MPGLNLLRAVARRCFDPLPRSAPFVTEARRQVLSVQCILDTSARTRSGIPVYLVMWLSVCTVAGVWRNAGGVVAAHAVVLLALALIRFAVQRRLPALVERDPIRSNAVFSTVVLINGAYWGWLTGVTMNAPWGTDVWWMMLAMAVSMAAAGTMGMGINNALRFSYAASLLVPMALVAFAETSQRNLMLLILYPALLFYAITVSGLVQADYWAAVVGRLGAEERAQQMEEASQTDGLTGIPNRMAFDSRLAQAWVRAVADGSCLALLMIDLDHFKRLNDTRGHPFGDECLKAVAGALRGAMRTASDQAFRYGGEEFVVLLPDTDRAGALVTATRLLQRVRELRLRDGDDEVSITCSIGLAAHAPADGGEPAALLRRADAALYRAKSEGRDRFAG